MVEGIKGKKEKCYIVFCTSFLKKPHINQPNSAQLIGRHMPSGDKVLFTLKYEHFALQCNLNFTLLKQNKKSQQYVCSYHSFWVHANINFNYFGYYIQIIPFAKYFNVNILKICKRITLLDNASEIFMNTHIILFININFDSMGLWWGMKFCNS